MTLEEFDREAQKLFQTARSWTKKTAPQTMAEFPFLPDTILSLCEKAVSATSSIEKDGSKYYFITNINDVMQNHNSGWDTGDYDIRLYYSGANNSTENIKMLPIGGKPAAQANKYELLLPDGIQLNKGKDITLGPHWYFGSEQWQEGFSVFFLMKNGKLTGDIVVHYYVTSNGTSTNPREISWDLRKSTNRLIIDIVDFKSGRVWMLTYDYKTGKLLNITK